MSEDLRPGSDEAGNASATGVSDAGSEDLVTAALPEASPVSDSQAEAASTATAEGGDEDTSTVTNETVDPGAKDTYVDEDTALARGRVEDEERTVAAQERAAAKKIEQFEPVAEGDHSFDDIDRHGGHDFLNDRNDPDGSLRRNKNKAEDELGQDPFIAERNFNASTAGVETAGPIYTYTSQEAMEGKEERRFAKGFREDAEKRDKLADRLGDWAEVLHKKPPSEAYLKEVLGWETIEPKDLVYLERGMELKINDAERSERELDVLEERYVGQQAEHDKQKQRLGDTIREMDPEIADRRWSWSRILTDKIDRLTDGDQATRSEFRDLEAHNSTTIGDLKAFYRRLTTERGAMIRKAVSTTQKHLEDIRTGTAAAYKGEDQAA